MMDGVEWRNIVEALSHLNGPPFSQRAKLKSVNLSEETAFLDAFLLAMPVATIRDCIDVTNAQPRRQAVHGGWMV